MVPLAPATNFDHFWHTASQTLGLQFMRIVSKLLRKRWKGVCEGLTGFTMWWRMLRCGGSKTLRDKAPINTMIIGFDSNALRSDRNRSQPLLVVWQIYLRFQWLYTIIVARKGTFNTLVGSSLIRLRVIEEDPLTTTPLSTGSKETVSN